MKKLKEFKTFLHEVPPWIIIGSMMILMPIFFLWALDTIHRQKESTTTHLLERGEDIIRSIEAGTGATTSGTTDQESFTQLKKLLTETAQLSHIKYIAIVDSQGNITAHSNTESIKKKFEDFSTINNTAFSKEVQWRQVKGIDNGNIIEVYRRFSPGHHNDQSRHGKWIDDKDHSIKSLTGKANQEAEQVIFVGLDTSTFEETNKEDIRHTLIMGAILLLVGVAGISSLFFIQAYRTTKTSLRRIKAFSDNVVENMPVGIIALAPDRKVVSFNNTAEAIFQTKQSSVIGASVDSIIPPDIMTLLEDIERSRATIEKEVNYSAPDGRRLDIEVGLSIIRGDDGPFMGYLILIRDITEINFLKKEIEKSKRLASIGGLAAGVAHEIRNPLSSIKGFAAYISTRYNHVPEDKKLAEVMIHEVERLNRVVGQLLELSKPVNIVKKPYSVATLISHSIKVIERNTEKKNIRINIKDIPDLPLINVDSDSLTQALLNLYLNAGEAMPDGGTLSIEADQEQISGMLRITIEDTGRGIDKKDLAHVFDPYFTTKQSGTGLGLSIVHRIIESHDGQISIESELNKGTRVTILLPFI